jgi:hypothetical protein
MARTASPRSPASLKRPAADLKSLESEATAQDPSGFSGVSALNLTEVAKMHSYHVVSRWIAMIAVCAFLGVLAGCAQLGVGAGEGSSSPPLDSANYVFPPPDLQVYD